MKILLATPLAALALLTAAGCASTSAVDQSRNDGDCSKSMSAANGADCKSAAMAPPVVDISRPTPAPGIAASKPAAPDAK